MAAKSLVEQVLGFWAFNTKVIVGGLLMLLGVGIVPTGAVTLGLGTAAGVALFAAGSVIVGDAFGVKLPKL